MKNDNILKLDNSIDVRNQDQLDNAFDVLENIVTREYLARLNELEVIDNSDELKQAHLYEYGSIFKVEKIVYDKDENNLQKLVNTYASSMGFNSNLVMIINSTNEKTELYLGTTGAKTIDVARASAEALCNNFVGNFPGSLSKFDDIVLSNRDIEQLLDKCTRDTYKSISCVSGISSQRLADDADNVNYVQGIEKLLDTMRGETFSAIFIANNINREHLLGVRREYELLYSELVPFLKSDLTFNEGTTESVASTLTNSLNNTLTSSSSLALSVGKGNSYTTSTTEGKSQGIGISFFKANLSNQKNYQEGKTYSKNDSDTNIESESKSRGESYSESESKTTTSTYGRTLQISYINKTIQNYLELIDEQLKRLKDGENYGLYASPAYFLASNPMTTKMAASAYKSLINGNSSYLQSAYINSWMDERKVKIIKDYLHMLQHPLFKLDNLNSVTPATMITSKELAVQMGLPKKSIPGVSVIESASFGRNVKKYEAEKDKYINLGNLYHMGRDEETANGGNIPVKLDLDSLTMHTFITGSTGAGKSNAIYYMLENARKNYNINFLVIEPAKGEYKDKFGYREDVRVLGTNKNKTELLKINPFSFPNEVHVLEHIDRLIEIFNVCWPMYAAMPAVLKDSIERAYVVTGWNLENSKCEYRDENDIPLYPCFADVLEQIQLVMGESKYSSDSKGDYIGALSTRLRSLTNGLYRQIFTTDELSNEELYDKNVIVDLSRVGSVETKSLIMGLLILKMQEYRMSKQESNNKGLKHLTVLEEAHNLLKRTSTEQSSESSNLLGKSVEMLANSIAEMRTYGEGFIIADQAPGLLDMSVIRNTNTKIILRLPDISDRELVGKSASLNENQINELSKLQTGVAAIYQNDWLEPVLCHINRSLSKETKYIYSKKSNMELSEEQNLQKLIKYVLSPIDESIDLDEVKKNSLKKCVYDTNINSKLKIMIIKFLDSSNFNEKKLVRKMIICNLFDIKEVLAFKKEEKENINLWYTALYHKLEPRISMFDKREQELIILILLQRQKMLEKTSDNIKMYKDFREFMRR